MAQQSPEEELYEWCVEHEDEEPLAELYVRVCIGVGELVEFEDKYPYFNRLHWVMNRFIDTRELVGKWVRKRRAQRIRKLIA